MFQVLVYLSQPPALRIFPRHACKGINQISFLALEAYHGEINQVEA